MKASVFNCLRACPTTILKHALALLLLALTLSGCGHDHDHDHADAGHGHSHGDDAESFSGATHKEGGITLLDETRRLLGIQTAEVQEQTLPRQIRFTARVFDAGATANHLALGTVSTNDAALLRPGLPVQFQTASGTPYVGVIQQVSQPLANADAEIISAFSLSASTLQQGDSGNVSVSVPGEKATLVVPREAVINGTSGDLVYAVNGDAYTLTWVELGVEANGMIEIKDGLFAGDSVVTRGVMDLWLVELRAVKGGQGCCPAPPKKGKS